MDFLTEELPAVQGGGWVRYRFTVSDTGIGMSETFLKTVPIIALTANAFADDIQTAMAAGMTAHVAKPIDVAVLKATLSRVLEA